MSRNGRIYPENTLKKEIIKLNKRKEEKIKREERKRKLAKIWRVK